MTLILILKDFAITLLFTKRMLAFTRIIAFILTGKATVYRIQDINLKSFVEKWGIFKSKRYKSVDEMIVAFKKFQNIYR